MSSVSPLRGKAKKSLARALLLADHDAVRDLYENEVQDADYYLRKLLTHPGYRTGDLGPEVIAEIVERNARLDVEPPAVFDPADCVGYTVTFTTASENGDNYRRLVFGNAHVADASEGVES